MARPGWARTTTPSQRIKRRSLWSRPHRSRRLPVIGLADAGMGEIYARQGKVPEANAAYDAAAKADPADALLHLRNEAVIFFQQNNGPAQIAAADEAIKSDPNQADPGLAILYYIKGQGLIANAQTDPKNPSKVILPPDCAAAYEKYLELAPNGPFASEVSRHPAGGRGKGSQALEALMITGRLRERAPFVFGCACGRSSGSPGCSIHAILLFLAALFPPPHLPGGRNHFLAARKLAPKPGPFATILSTSRRASKIHRPWKILRISPLVSPRRAARTGLPARRYPCRLLRPFLPAVSAANPCPAARQSSFPASYRIAFPARPSA